MKISVLCTDNNHPIFSKLLEWCKEINKHHDVELLQNKNDLSGGDILYLISCHEVIGENVRSFYKHSLVIHASDLPSGRGWSPHVWQILEGRNNITVTLLEAEDKVDTGRIWHQVPVSFEGHELFDEINEIIFNAEIELMDFAIQNVNTVNPRIQSTEKIKYYPLRKPEDSRINPELALSEQFDLLRVADSVRYPAFFDFHGQRYKISISKMKRGEE